MISVTTGNPLSVSEFIEARHLIEPPDFHYVQPEGRGSVFHEEGRILTRLAARLAEGSRVLEIGAAVGISSRYILHGLAPNAHLDSIDILHRWRTNDARHTQLVGLSTDYFPIEKTYDLAFVDGDHRYAGALSDIEACLAAGIPLVVVHDTNTDNIPPSNGTLEGSDAYAATLAAALKFPDYSLLHLKTHCGLSFLYKGSLHHA